MKKTKLAIFLCLVPIFLFAKPLSKDEVKNLGIKAFAAKARDFRPSATSYTLKNCVYLEENNELYAAVLHFEHGFLIMSADDAVMPVLAYDFDNEFDETNLPPAVQQLLDQYKSEIFAVRRNNLKPNEIVLAAWNSIFDNTTEKTRDEGVKPLLKSTWNQNKYYNYYSPKDENSPSGYDSKTPNGCVAVAMSQIMYYYRYPSKGFGSHTNYSSYGNFSVNFAQQTYNYDAMRNELNYYNNEVAKLIFHCGVAVNMQYGADGSGAYSQDVPSAMSGYFGYSTAAQHVSKYQYSNGGWNSMLKGELDNNRPIYYSGYSSEGGHAFVCDGYNSDDYFHFNFGWGGYDNGYFVTSSTQSDDEAVGGYSDYQSAIKSLYPAENAYPEYCNDRVITATNGTLEDGSGHKNYQNNQYCTYIITGDFQYAVQIKISEMDTQEGHDFLRFWNGHPSKGDTLMEISGGMPSETTYLFDADSLYITFETDGEETAQGWHLSFQSYRENSGCGVHQLYTEEGVITDNSEDGNYRDNSNCIWNIRLYDAQYVKFVFEEFDVSPEDFVAFYNLSSASGEFLYSFSGNTIPEPIIIPLSKIRVQFVSDNYLNAQGFKISWYSDNALAAANEELDVLSIFPNPASNSVKVYCDEQFSRENLNVKLFDVVGNCVYSNMFQTSVIDIPVANLSEGIYMMNISNGKKSVNKKIVVKH